MYKKTKILWDGDESRIKSTSYKRIHQKDLAEVCLLPSVYCLYKSDKQAFFYFETL